MEAVDLARTQRHDFRDRLDALAAYAPKYDAYVGTYRHKLEEADLHVSAEAHYVRGVAAHYGNQPVLALNLLVPLATTVGPDDSNGKRLSVEGKRSAIASYFVGLIESNFRQYEAALKWFDASIALEPDEAIDDQGASPRFKDVLTRVVAAEACAMSGEPARTSIYIEDVQSCLEDAMKKCRRRNIPLPKTLLYLEGRAKLVEANMLLRQTGKLHLAMDILKALSAKADSTYFSLVTYAQVLMDANPDSKEAREHFTDAYMKIRNLNHLVELTELRSKILVRIVAGMSARYTTGFENASEPHLDSAIALLSRLPKRDNQICTVFSPFSKRNESPEDIEKQITEFRERGVLLSM
jgi:tetratricopeptide (TPR) repeat protein